ncbi:homoserine O-acetyltransferase MetX [Alteribacter keqinensis]|uniref:Homoserine O-acetyltransferase n=1 Tax=Alteribacter keqinensis TaxID=2483800 RepID=A0A3M7TZY2_9BACI|nr:homoserine O-acetyltransferase [Alteribacter keqinensis]RNA70452.1 homoserine O-acetyltransferase [Alteribacter keqinensis]
MSVHQKRTTRFLTGEVIIPELQLESGETLTHVTLAYERAGAENGAPLLICHALTGNQHTVGSKEDPGWWRGLADEGGYIDLYEHDVITFNVIGGCNGSTGPVSVNPKTDDLYRSDFPFISVRDMVHAQKLALDQMGITKLKAVIGGSLGGMQALEWGLSYPDITEQLIIMAATPSLSDYGMAYNAIARKAITDDPKWKDGKYLLTDPPVNGLSLARMTGMITYRSGNLFNQRFHREGKAPWGKDHTEVAYQVESYLRYQGDKFTTRFDANSYLYLLKAMDQHDIERDRNQSLENLLSRYKKRVTLLAFQGDLLYPPEEIKRLQEIWLEAGGDVRYLEIDTIFGHDGFLTEYTKWGGYVQQALSQ